MNLNDDLETERLIQEQQTTGVTTDKGKVEETLRQITLKHIFALKGYAADIDNNELYEKVNYTKSELKKVSDNILIDR